MKALIINIIRAIKSAEIEGIADGQVWYRFVYLNSPGWKLTRWLRKQKHCYRCGIGGVLHLHHEDYRGYRWYNLILPDLISRMKTLCPPHHRIADKMRGKIS